MNTSFLGLDIGQSSIKAVVFRKSIGRSSDFTCQGTRYPAGLEVDDSTDEFKKFLRNFLIRHQLTNSRVIASIPGEWVWTRVLTFPFSHPQKIAKTLPLELESFLPVNVSEMVIDHQILTSTSRQTQVLVIAVPKEKLQRRIDLLTHVGLDVRAIEVQSLAMFNAYRWIHPHLPKEGILVLDVGPTATSLCLLGPEGLWGIRTLLFGLNDFSADVPVTSKILEKELDRPHELSSERKPGKESTSDITSNEHNPSAWDTFLQSLRITIHTFESQTGTNVAQTYVVGEGAKAKGFLAKLASQSEVPDPQIFSERVGRTGRLISPVFLPALGLSIKLASGSRGSTINASRKMAHEETARRDSQKTWMKTAIGVGIVVALILANIFVMHHFKESRYEELQQHLRSEFQEVFPQTQAIVNEIQQTQSAMFVDQRMLDYFRGNHTTVLQILADLSQRLGQEGETKVHEVLIDGQTVTLQATTGSFEAIERIKRLVSEVTWVNDLRVLDAQAGSVANRISFSLNITVEAA